VNGGKRALEFTVPKQVAELSDGVVKQLGSGQDIIFLRYYSKFEKGFDQTGSSHNGGILNALAPGWPIRPQGPAPTAATSSSSALRIGAGTLRLLHPAR